MVQLIPLPPYHLLLHQNPHWFNLSGTGLPGCPQKEAVKRVNPSVGLSLPVVTAAELTVAASESVSIEHANSAETARGFIAPLICQQAQHHVPDTDRLTADY